MGVACVEVRINNLQLQVFFGNRRVTRLHAEIDSPSDEDSFITHILGRRIMSKHVILK